jgi:hypothetical protein
VTDGAQIVWSCTLKKRRTSLISFADFIAPGLIVMGMMNNAFANASFSLLVGKIQGTKIEPSSPNHSTAKSACGVTCTPGQIAIAAQTVTLRGGAAVVAVGHLLLGRWAGTRLPCDQPCQPVLLCYFTKLVTAAAWSNFSAQIEVRTPSSAKKIEPSSPNHSLAAGRQDPGDDRRLSDAAALHGRAAGRAGRWRG